MIAAVPLTARQARVMDLVVDGWSDDEIAVRMGLSTQRIKQHVVEARLYYGDAPNRTKAAVAHDRAKRRTRRAPRIAAGQADLELA